MMGMAVASAVVNSWCWRQDQIGTTRGGERSVAFLGITSFHFIITLDTVHEDDNKFFQFRKFGNVFFSILDRNAIFISSGSFPSLSSVSCQIFPGIGSSFHSQKQKYL